MLCCGKRSKEPKTPVPKTPGATAFEHYKAPHFGIADILLPRSHDVKELKDGRLAGRTLWPIGKFEIQLLFNAAHVEREKGYFDMQLPSVNFQQQLDMDLGMPKDSYLLCTNVHFNFMAADPGASAALSHRMLLMSPFGHGLSVLYTCAQKDLEELKLLVKTMIPSLKWVDRNTVCTTASDQLQGKWRCTFQVDTDNTEAGVKTISRRMANLNDKKRFTIENIKIRRPMESSIPTTEDDENDKATVVSTHTGSFEVSVFPSKRYMLFMLDDDHIVDEQWKHASVEEMFMDKDKFTKDGEEWSRCG